MAQVKNIPLIESTLREYILRKFKEGEKIKEIPHGFQIAEIKIEGVSEVANFSVTITPDSGLIKAYYIGMANGANIMGFIHELFESQQTSHIIDEIKKLK